MESANAVPVEWTFEINPVRRPGFSDAVQGWDNVLEQGQLVSLGPDPFPDGGSGFQIDRVACAVEHQLFEPSEGISLVQRDSCFEPAPSRFGVTIC